MFEGSEAPSRAVEAPFGWEGFWRKMEDSIPMGSIPSHAFGIRANYFLP
jgi:hypothetical protein